MTQKNQISYQYWTLEKYWVTQSGYFRLATTVDLDMGIIYGKLLDCYGVAEGNEDKKISTFEYNNRTVYDWFNNLFSADLVAQICIYLTSPLMMVPPPHKRALYTQNILPDVISVASGNYVSTLTTPSGSPDLLPTDDHNNLHVMKKDVPLKGRFNRRYCCRKHGQIRCYKNTMFYCCTCSDKDKSFYYFHGFSRIFSETSTCFLEHQHSL